MSKRTHNVASNAGKQNLNSTYYALGIQYDVTLYASFNSYGLWPRSVPPFYVLVWLIIYTCNCDTLSIHINGEDINFCCCLETECRLFPPVTQFLDLFLCAGYFFNALY